MSTTHQTIILYGWDIGTEQYEEYTPEPGDNTLDNELWKDYGEGESEVELFYDGRGLEYCFLGIVIDRTNTTREGPQYFDSPINLDEGGPTGEQLFQLGRAIGKHNLDVDLYEPSYHIFTHTT